MIKLTCEKCGGIVWPWQEQASFGHAGFHWWQAMKRWHTSCLVRRYSEVPADWSDNES